MEEMRKKEEIEQKEARRGDLERKENRPGETEQESIISVQGLGKVFHTASGDFTALDDIHLDIQKGQIQGIIGLSGAGKSTLVRCINFLERPSSGQIFFHGKSLSTMKEKEILAMRQNMGMIFQQFNLLEQRNLLQNVCFPLEIADSGFLSRALKEWKDQKRKAKSSDRGDSVNRGDSAEREKTEGKPSLTPFPVILKALFSGRARKEKRIQRAQELLKLVGLEGREKSYPAQLSGGQKQRVAIARALATNPEVLLCDEATSALDPKTTEQILSLLKKINREMGVTIIIITHQMSVIESICDEVAIIDHSHIAECGPVKEVFQSPKTEIGKRLILGEGEKEAFFGSGRRFRIVFDGRKAHEPILSELILALHTPVNILFANTKEVDGMAVGQMVIELPENMEDILHVTEFMKERGIAFEEVRR
jgi:ABC-type metal ion transport system, ATPase component